MRCDHNCGSCAGCGVLELTQLELELLELLGQVAFLPVARKADEEYPVCKELQDPQQAGLALVCLEKRGLVDISYDGPLKGMDMSAYADYPVHGSVGLTVKGQEALDAIGIQGIVQ